MFLSSLADVANLCSPKVESHKIYCSSSVQLTILP